MHEGHFRSSYPLEYTRRMVAMIPGYDEMMLTVREVARQVCLSRTAVLQLGAGSGHETRMLLLAGANPLLIVDYSPSVIDHVSTQFSIDIHLGRISLLRDSITSESCWRSAGGEGGQDLIVATLIFHDLDTQEWPEFFRHALASLRTGGRLLITDAFNTDGLADEHVLRWKTHLGEAGFNVGEWLEEDPHLFHPPVLSDVRAVFEREGFRLDSIAGAWGHFVSLLLIK